MFKQIILAAFLMFVLNNDLTAQRKHVVFFSLGGAAGLAYSLNYDVRLLNRPDGFGINVGASLVPAWFIEKPGVYRMIFPFQANYLFGKKKHQFELGIGATYTKVTKYEGVGSRIDETFNPTATVAYRFQGKHFMFRVEASPRLERTGSYDGWMGTPPFPGISFGYAF